MYASGLEFDIAQFKTVMEEAPSKENGWNFIYEGMVDKTFSDSTMKIYSKEENSKTGFTTRVDAVMKGVKAKNVMLMIRDINYRKKAERPPKKIKILEKVKNTDVIYVELDLPDPLTNRDLLQKRLFVGNKDDPELVKKLDLFDWDHEYHAIIVESIERADYPPMTKPIRAEMKMHHMLLEEVPDDPTLLKIRVVSNMELNGEIPDSMMKAIRENAPIRMMTSILDNYLKFFGAKTRG